MIKKEDLKVGMRVTSLLFVGKGTIYDIINKGNAVTIRRDDGLCGGGSFIPGYGCGWHIWGSDAGFHSLNSVENEEGGEQMLSSEFDTLFDVGDRVEGRPVTLPSGSTVGAKYTGVVVRIVPTTVTVRRDDSGSEWGCTKRNDGSYGSDCASGLLINLTKGKGKMSKITEKYIAGKMAEPTKTLKDAGIVDQSGKITPDGIEFVSQFLLEKNAVDIAAVLKPIIEAEK
jgi:hypothetical protein